MKKFTSIENINEENINESILDVSNDIALNPMELFALYAMIDATDTTKQMQKTKHKMENSLRSHMTYILRECHDLRKYYTYDDIFKEKSKEEADKLLDVIISEIDLRNKNKKGAS